MLEELGENNKDEILIGVLDPQSNIKKIWGMIQSIEECFTTQ